MGQRVSRIDFEWTYSDEPHTSRRKAMLAKYPQIKKLFGIDPMFKYVVTLMVLTQFLMCYIMIGKSWSMILLVAYCFGGVINHSLSLAIHEISHNLAFGHAYPTANRWFGIFANLPLGVPMFMSFKIYHREHHKYLGQDTLDPDLPTLMEAKLFSTTFGKFCWVCLQPLFYAIRPLIVRPLKPTQMEYANVFVQLVFNAIVTQYCGWHVMFYLVIGTLLTMGFHPIAGHFIAEHYMFAKGFETYSYYGPLNVLTFNVGYHNEHHDFPYIAGSRLPQLKVIAPDFYENMPQHSSWIRVLYDFITDPAVGPYARHKRKAMGLDS
ncbi:sphingolipid delta(4)-desaturase DES1-like [Bradysia coprophila]|uniref:sphingolipid delta(4)-desaturase DES1-like n=1 Tax=Bradysia coprophila TaxID=38358 RepID=UPI00187DB249|nr:sphingolipid delta(4)-desaturase DES1-like [Bradysia coprophila]